MTITDTQFTVPSIAAEDRAQRLTDAAAAWGERIAVTPSSAHLTYRVNGTGIGSVATEVTVGKHSFLVDEPDSLAGDDIAASRLFGVDESVRAGFSEVRLSISISGPDSQERYDELREVIDAHCPVLDLFANPTPVSVTVTKA